MIHAGPGLDREVPRTECDTCRSRTVVVHGLTAQAAHESRGATVRGFSTSAIHRIRFVIGRYSPATQVPAT